MQRKQGFPSILTVSIFCAFGLLGFAQAQTVTTLVKFNGSNGWQPFGPVVQATDGNFYGTTAFGGNGYGNVYQVTPSGKVTSIYSFCSETNCADGQTPETPPILGSDGNLYGVTLAGGSSGNGVFYRMTLAGRITVLHSFCSSSGCTDGANPSGVMQASDGNFYGSASGGTQGVGMIFKISPSGNLTTTYTFCSQANCADGAYVGFPPIQGIDGNFYGVTDGGGTESGGVLYELTASGTYKVLYNFCLTGSCPGGSIPNTIVQDSKGNFFGTTLSGGSFIAGTAFEFTSAGTYKVLHNFSASGVGQAQALTLASDGNLYGMTGGGSPLDGGDGVGSIFEITPAGRFTSLYTFCNCGNPTNGYNPEGALFQGTDGNFYETTIFGGTSGQNYGTVFKLSKGLSPLVETVPVAGKVGKKIIILGNGLKGSTSVTFSGKAAAFTVVSDTEITATVPSGATTGTVSVVTQTGTLKSNPQFVVTK